MFVNSRLSIPTVDSSQVKSILAQTLSESSFTGKTTSRQEQTPLQIHKNTMRTTLDYPDSAGPSSFLGGQEYIY